jgi:hypothetical protein
MAVQLVDSGQVQLDAGNSTATIRSFIASFAPFVGGALSSGITSVSEFLETKKLNTNTRKMNRLVSDATSLSQLLGKSAYEIAINMKYQEHILKTTDEDLKNTAGNLFQKMFQFCEAFQEKIDVYLYSDMYKTPAERIGHIK